MLFPLVEKSLRGEIKDRHLRQDASSATFSQTNKFSGKEILTIFAGILDGITTMHQHNISQRDVKMGNILLRQRRTTYRNKRNRSVSAATSACYTPVLMDFGSAGPLSIQLNTRHAVLSAIETATQHTMLSYRSPELFEVGYGTIHPGKKHSTTVRPMYGRWVVYSSG
jgi:serine/threonine kinase 16